MSEQQRRSARRTTGSHDDVDDVEVTETDTDSQAKAKLDDDVDSILDEIDGVLEENAEEFVRSFVQKGGQ